MGRNVTRAKASKKMKRAVETEEQRAARLERAKQQRIGNMARAAGVPDHQIARGELEEMTLVDLSGELGKRMSMRAVLVNRGGTAVDRWIHRDTTGLFGESEERAIRYTQNLWVRLEGGLRAIDPAADVVDMPLGWSQQEALVELKSLQERVPRPYWDCFENVCRFDEEAGVAGSKLASNSRSAIDAARTCVAFTASLIAQWRRL